MKIFNFLGVLIVIARVVASSINAEDEKHADDTSETNDHYSNNEHDEDQGGIRVVVRIDDIQKSERDERSYRGLVLSNGLQVLLISDPETDMAAASLTVDVGNMHDPEEIPGLAHLLEHMLFMGSEKYPEEDYFSVFVKERAGMKSGITAEDYQQYYFRISSTHLAKSLDIMAQMLIQPRLTPSALEREVNAVDSEMNMNSIDDNYILELLARSLSKRGHSHAKFRCGNKKSLQTDPQSKGIDIHAKLSSLFRERFSSNLMNVAVLGKESLENLETMVVPVYGKIENKKIAKSIYREHPWGPEQLNREVRFVPTSDANIMRIYFPSPDLWKPDKDAHVDYVRHLLHLNGSGCLSTDLARRNWLYGLDAGSAAVSGFGFFVVTFRLTEEGLSHVNEILKLVFQYFYFLKKDGNKKSVFDELQKLNKLAFRCKDKEDPLCYVNRMSSSLRLGIPFVDILSDHIPDEWNPSIIEGLLDYLVPENMNVFIGSKLFENEVDLVEQWYGTKYSVRRISEDLINGMWKITQPYGKFRLPPPSKFTSGSVNLDPLETERLEFPRIIHESEISQFWFKRDDEFKIPKFYIRVKIFNPRMCSNARSHELTEIFIKLVHEGLQNRFDGYVMLLEGLIWNMSAMNCGLRFTLSGYTEKLLKFTKLFLVEMVNFEIREEKFEIIRQFMARNHKNFNTNQPFDQVTTHLHNLMYETVFTAAESYAVQKMLLVDDMRKFKKQLFSRVFIQGLIYGNCDEKLAKAVVSTIEQAFPSKSVVLAREIMPLRFAELEDGTNFIFEAQHGHSAESGYLGYFQIGPDCSHQIRNAVLTHLFVQIVSEKCFKTLRTDEQLGYTVRCVWRGNNGILSFVVIVQSIMHPVHVNARVEAFLRELRQNLIEMSSEEFETNKSSLRGTYLKKMVSQVEKLNNLWEEMESRHYHFGLNKENAALLDTLRKEDIIEFFETYIAESSSKRRKLEIHVTSKITSPPLPVDEPIDELVKIEDPIIFASGLAYYFNTASRRGIAPVGISESRRPSPKKPEMNFCRRAFYYLRSFILRDNCTIL